MKKINSLIAILLINSLLFADATDFVSPQSAGSSPSLISSITSTSGVLNPGLTADIQRYTFDFSYFYLMGLSDIETGNGHIVNLSGAKPSKYGVFSATGNMFLNSGITSTDLNLGNTFHLNLNFAKELYSDLSFGAGLTSLLGSKDGVFDWGLGLNLGFVKDFGNVHKNIQDLVWGLSLMNLGKII